MKKMRKSVSQFLEIIEKYIGNNDTMEENFIKEVFILKENLKWGTLTGLTYSDIFLLKIFNEKLLHLATL